MNDSQNSVVLLRSVTCWYFVVVIPCKRDCILIENKRSAMSFRPNTSKPLIQDMPPPGGFPQVSGLCVSLP
jgi:hypothetical protein